MCEKCQTTPDPSRRVFMKALGASLAISALVPLTGIAEPPKPENVISSTQALERLMVGNDRYVNNKSRVFNFNETRAALTKGQNPFACILSCADSRIGPELCFDTERGDLFVTRVAGNYVSTPLLASLEYGTEVLKAPLILVLGHTNCGAIKAAISAVNEGTGFPGHIQCLTSDLIPAVRSAMKKNPSDLELASIRENVSQNMEKLRESAPILSKRVEQGSLKIVGGIYHLHTGRVELIET